MSFNPSYSPVDISRSNYEEYFLLYVDGELSPEACKAVEAFAAQHPDLAAELEALKATVLPGEEIVFENKSALQATQMKLQEADEKLLLLLDDELPADEAAIFEKEIAQDAALMQQWQLLQKTKLQPEEVAFPDKNILYRHTQVRRLPVYFRAAAAVLLLIGLGTFGWKALQETTFSKPHTAIADKKDNGQNEVEQKAGNDFAIKANNIDKTKVPVINNSEKNAVDNVEKPQPVMAKTNQKAAHGIAQSAPAEKPSAASTFSKAHAPVVKEMTTLAPQQDIVQIQPSTKAIKKKMVPLDVTSDAPPAYVSTDATANAPVENAAGFEAAPAKRNGSLKVLLRKATRNLERRAGIKAVTADDELLVGAVAIQL